MNMEIMVTVMITDTMITMDIVTITDTTTIMDTVMTTATMLNKKFLKGKHDELLEVLIDEVLHPIVTAIPIATAILLQILYNKCKQFFNYNNNLNSHKCNILLNSMMLLLLIQTNCNYFVYIPFCPIIVKMKTETVKTVLVKIFPALFVFGILGWSYYAFVVIYGANGLHYKKSIFFLCWTIFSLIWFHFNILMVISCYLVSTHS